MTTQQCSLSYLYKTPYLAEYATLEELCKAHECTVEQLSEIADLNNPVECVLCSMKLAAKNANYTDDTLRYWLTRKQLILLLANSVYSEKRIEDYDLEEMSECVDIGTDEVVRETCNLLSIPVENNQVDLFKLQDMYIDADIEINFLLFALEKDIPTDSELYIAWQNRINDMNKLNQKLK